MRGESNADTFPFSSSRRDGPRKETPMLKIGLCGGIPKAPLAADAGFDYMETSVNDALQPREDDSAFQSLRDQWAASPLPLEALNGFIPGDLKICGPDRPYDALMAYMRTAVRRADALGVRRIVFGSGAARRVPDGFPMDEAWKQLVEFGRQCGEAASGTGVTIAVEPLNPKECNVVDSVRKGAQLVRDIDHPHVRLLVDSYHWGVSGETAEDILSCAGLFVHTHAATWPNRRVPGVEPSDFASFFRALARAGYRDGRVSVEAGCDNPERDLSRAVQCLREALAAVDAEG